MLVAFENFELGRIHSIIPAMIIHRPLRHWLCVLFVTTLAIFESQAAPSKSPKVVVFLVDDLGYMDIGANNPDCFYETPNIDKLATSGVRFTDGYAANPVCSPTRYSLMTGKYPTRVQATNFFSGKTGREI